MRTATDLLSQYAAYHRDRRNIVSHLVGVPMIVFAIGVLLARPSVPLGGSADHAGLGHLCAGGGLVPHARQCRSRPGRHRRRRPPDAVRAQARSPRGSPGASASSSSAGSSSSSATGTRARSRRSSTIWSACSSGRCSSSPRRCSRSAGTGRCSTRSSAGSARPSCAIWRRSPERSGHSPRVRVRHAPAVPGARHSENQLLTLAAATGRAGSGCASKRSLPQ